MLHFIKIIFLKFNRLSYFSSMYSEIFVILPNLGIIRIRATNYEKIYTNIKFTTLLKILGKYCLKM